MSKLKKSLLISGGVLVLLVVLILVFSSAIVKWAVEKYDVQLTGREITVEGAYANPLTGSVRLNGVRIAEANSDSLFLSIEKLSADIAMLGLLSGKYEVSDLIVHKPVGYAIQHEKDFNFTDIIELFAGDTLNAKASNPVHLSLLDIRVEEGVFYYTDETTPINYFIKNVNIESSGLRYEVDSLPVDFAFSSGIGSGEVNGKMMIHLDNLNYDLAFNVANFDLEIINQYLKDITNYGTFTAMLDAEMETKGNFGSTDSLCTKGKLAVSDFHFGKSRNEDYASFENLSISIREMSPKDLVYQYDSVILNKPFFRFEFYDDLDNVQTMFGVDGSNVTSADSDPNKFNLVIEIARLVETLSRNFFRSQYMVDRAAIYDGNIEYADYSLGEQFTIALNPFTIEADSIDKKRPRIEARMKSGIQPYGNAKVLLSINPSDTGDFDVDYRFQKIALSMFNPYLITYTSFPLDRGTLELSGKWKVRESMVESDNHLVMIDLRAGSRVKSKDNGWLPVPLALAFVRERGNVVDYEIPITGNLNDPNFHWRDVVFDLFENIFMKPVTTPYRMEVRTLERELEKSFSLKWPMGEVTIKKSQEKFIEKLVDYLKDHPDEKVTIVPEIFTVKEKEFILMYEAKKKYYIATRGKKAVSFNDRDSVNVVRMSIKDPEFVEYMDKQVDDSMLFTAQHKAASWIKESEVDSKFKRLADDREKAFRAAFIKNKVEKQVIMKKPENTVPFDGFSLFSISFNGELPEYLREAYNKMEQLNSRDPRESYQKKRESIKSYKK